LALSHLIIMYPIYIAYTSQTLSLYYADDEQSYFGTVLFAVFSSYTVRIVLTNKIESVLHQDSRIHG
jgi:hypothetical protein